MKPDLLRFLRSTDQIMVDDPLPFFAVTTGVAETALQRDSALARAAISLEYERAKEIITGKAPEEYEAWSDTLFNEIRQYDKERDDQFLRNVLLTTSSLIDHVPQEWQQAYANGVCRWLQVARIQKSLGPETASIVFPLAVKAEPTLAVTALSCYLKASLTAEGIEPRIGEMLEQCAQDLPPRVTEALNQEVLEAWQRVQKSTLLLEAYKKWPARSENVGKLVTPPLLMTLLDEYAKNTPGLVNELDEVMFRLKPAWNPHVTGRIVDLLLKPFREGPQGNALDATQLSSLR